MLKDFQGSCHNKDLRLAQIRRFLLVDPDSRSERGREGGRAAGHWDGHPTLFATKRLSLLGTEMGLHSIRHFYRKGRSRGGGRLIPV